MNEKQNKLVPLSYWELRFLKIYWNLKVAESKNRKVQNGRDNQTTQKPVEINERALLNFTKKGDFVCDFFTGSGSNLIACENMGRKFRGMELDTKYMQVIVERWCEYTSVDTIVINGQEVSWAEYKERK